ncbi:MAG: hypothetical protein RIR79_773 [Pseudomonadota bacterium]
MLAVYFVILTLKPQWFGEYRSGRGNVVSESITLLEANSSAKTGVNGAVDGSFRAAARKASAAVVSINTSKGGKKRVVTDELWLQFFFGDSSGTQPQTGLGSGVIVSPNGYIITNHHVIENADEIEVALNDGRYTLAKVIGSDPETDLAILKIELDKLPVILLGNSDTIQVGDQVLAIGNPFGVGQTVTSGIVSALGRNQLGINTFENFIQTDAAINPGNSGGALVDTEGNLLGINTAIFSQSGGSMGIGFAVPVSTAKQVLEGIVKDGIVTRGWIGIEPSDITPELAQTFEIKSRQGVLIKGVQEGGPAAKAGIIPSDVIVKIANQNVVDKGQLLARVAALKPGATIRFSIERKGNVIEVDVVLGVRRSRPAKMLFPKQLAK